MSRERWGFLNDFLSFFAWKRSGLPVALGVVLAGIAFAFLSSVQADAGNAEPQIAWVENFDQAVQLAKVHNKPLMIHFYGDHCPPCRMLEAKAFRNRELVLILNDNVIATKVNADKQREVAQRYQVTRWPTDVYLHADGTLIERGVSNQDPQAYARTVARVSQRHRDWALAQVAARDSQDRRDQQVATSDLSRFRSRIFGEATSRTAPVRVSSADWGREASGPVSPDAVVANNQSTRGQLPEEKLPKVQVINVEAQLTSASNQPSGPAGNDTHRVHPTEPSTLEPSSNRLSPQAVASEPISSEQQLAALAAVPGLGGFCPVALQDYLKLSSQAQSQRSPWLPGKEEFSVRHRGRIYRCASAESRERLLRDPDAFTPVFSGCDLVEFAKSGVLLEGKCDLGFIEQNTGRVFLFATRASYEEFARNCESYSNLSEPKQERMAQGQSATNVR